MKKKFCMALLAMSMGVASMTAQVSTERGVEFPPRVVTNSFWSNWFVGAGGGINLYFGDHDQHLPLGRRLGPSFQGYIGKWFTPGLGVRAVYEGQAWKGVSDYKDPTNQNHTEGLGKRGIWYKQRGNFGHAHVDVMLNILDMTTRYNPDRKYSIIPYVGAGLMHSYTNGHDELAMNAGLVNRFRLTNRLALNFQLQATWMKDNFDGEIRGGWGDVMTSAQLGLSYRIGKTGFSRNVVKFTGISQADYDAVNERCNTLREQVAKQQETIDQLKSVQPTVQTEQVVKSEKSVAPVLVVFDLGKSTLTKQQRVNLKYAAEAIKSCDGKQFTLEGYADNTTGTAEINERLSRERIAAVMECLVEEFGVPRSQLKSEVKGGVSNMFYNDPALSRAVIIK